MDERKSFEHWFSDEGKYPKAVERNLDGGYRIAQAASAWTAWQARAAIGGSESPSPPEAPKPDTLEAKAMEILSEMDTFGRKVLSGKVSDENIGGMAPLIIDTWAERLRAALAVSRSPAPNWETPTRNVLETYCETLGIRKGMPLHDLANLVCQRLEDRTFPAPTEGPTDDQLRACWYAPGEYMLTCRDCEKLVQGVDKRAARCRPCAVTLYHKSLADFEGSDKTQEGDKA
jgi:hypothetical protein